MKYCLFALLGLTSAQDGNEGIQASTDTPDYMRSKWEEVNPYYGEEKRIQCQSDDNCERGHVCVYHMWAYNNQHESAKGCWRQEVCTDTGSFFMFDERKIQWFCSDEQKDKFRREGGWLEYGLTELPYKHWDEYRESCYTNGDCTYPGQYCTNFYWDGKRDQSSSSYGSACYTWGDEVCPKRMGDTWGTVNVNYDNEWNKEFSYYQQYWCPETDDWHGYSYGPETEEYMDEDQAKYYMEMLIKL